MIINKKQQIYIIYNDRTKINKKSKKSSVLQNRADFLLVTPAGFKPATF